MESLLGFRVGPSCRGVAQLARAPVSKTGGWGFETLHPCQSCWRSIKGLVNHECPGSGEFVRMLWIRFQEA